MQNPSTGDTSRASDRSASEVDRCARWFLWLGSSPSHRAPPAVKCWLINTEHPQRPKVYANPIGQKKLDAALAGDPDLRDKIDKALNKWRASQQSGRSIAMDDGSPPTRTTVNTVQFMTHDPEKHIPEDETTQDHRNITEMLVDNGLKPTSEIYTAVSIDKDIDKLSNRWILGPGSNTHVINSENWTGWTREYDASATDFVGAGTGCIQITAWGRMRLMANTPSGMQSLTLTHVVYVEGFVTSLIGLTRCREMGIHFDSGRDLLYKDKPGAVLAYLEHDGGHWLVDTDVSCRPTPRLLSSFGTTYRPSRVTGSDQIIDARTAHQIWGHPGTKAIGKLRSNVDGLVVKGSTDDFCAVCTESKLTKQIPRRQQDDQP
jgi:hypothetical protein